MLKTKKRKVLLAIVAVLAFIGVGAAPASASTVTTANYYYCYNQPTGSHSYYWGATWQNTSSPQVAYTARVRAVGGGVMLLTTYKLGGGLQSGGYSALVPSVADQYQVTGADYSYRYFVYSGPANWC